MLADGQRHGGLAQGIGQAMWDVGDEQPVAADDLCTYIVQSIKNIQEMPLNMLLQGNIRFPEIGGERHGN
jgi:hypothetical protein